MKYMSKVTWKCGDMWPVYGDMMRCTLPACDGEDTMGLGKVFRCYLWFYACYFFDPSTYRQRIIQSSGLSTTWRRCILRAWYFLSAVWSSPLLMI